MAVQFDRLSAGNGVLTAVRTGTGRDLVLFHSLLAAAIARCWSSRWNFWLR
jgi:hypothetical protein